MTNALSQKQAASANFYPDSTVIRYFDHGLISGEFLVYSLAPSIPRFYYSPAHLHEAALLTAPQPAGKPIAGPTALESRLATLVWLTAGQGISDTSSGQVRAFKKG